MVSLPMNQQGQTTRYIFYRLKVKAGELAKTDKNWRLCQFGGRAQELCEGRGGRPGLPVPNKPTVSVDVRQHSITTVPPF